MPNVFITLLSSSICYPKQPPPDSNKKSNTNTAFTRESLLYECTTSSIVA